jgi:hypothetical protein
MRQSCAEPLNGTAVIPPLYKGGLGGICKSGIQPRHFQIPLSPPLLKGEAVSIARAVHVFIFAFEALIQQASGSAGGHLTLSDYQ